MREKVRQEKTKKHENGCPRKNTLIYIHMCIYTAKHTLFKYRYTYSNTDTHIQIYTLCITQVR